MMIEKFLRAIDAEWRHPTPSPVRLQIIGSTALMLQTDYRRGTKDSDVLEAKSLDSDVKRALLALAGPDTPLATKHRLYIDVVLESLPFLPQKPAWQDMTVLNESLEHFEVSVLSVVDVVVSKLKRFTASDRSDIDEMITLDLVPHEELVSRFEAAVDIFSHDARAEDLPRYLNNLHTIERDSFGVDETEIELPPWCY